MDRRSLLKRFGAALAAVPWLRRTSAGTPNIIFIMTDDQRQDALSVYGNTILKTPHIDRIGNEGARFTEAFVTNALCGPSRASFLTGLYSHEHGVISNAYGPGFENQPGLRPEHRTFVQLLREAGWYTGAVGKWHLPTWPEHFDQWIVFPGQGRYQDPEMIAHGARVRLRGHADDVTGDQALSFLEQRPKDKPFCLLYWFKSPHRSWMPAERHARAFENVQIPIPRTFEDRLEGRPEALKKAEMAIADMPDFRDRGVPESLPPAERKRLNLEHLVKNYYRVLLSVDENVGRVLDYLDSNALTRNTIVIYTSDNGFFLGEHGLFDKRLMYEPSIRIPFLVRHPETIKPGLVDRTHLITNVDLAPTLLELADIPAPLDWHGRSLLPLLQSKQTSWRDAFLYEYYEYPAEHCARKNRGVRTDRWKLIHFWEQPEEWELYDLQTDPDEMRNLANDPRHAAQLRIMKAKLDQLRRELRDQDPPGPAPIAQPCHP
jgi:arylsulfatase A-like enzyme